MHAHEKEGRDLVEHHGLLTIVSKCFCKSILWLLFFMARAAVALMGASGAGKSTLLNGRPVIMSAYSWLCTLQREFRLGKTESRASMKRAVDE